MTANKHYWDNIGEKYKSAWQTRAQIDMAKREAEFISKFSTPAITSESSILDIGCGTGRIIETHLKVLDSKGYKNNQIFGFDISEKMIEVCQQKFKGESRVSLLQQLDIAHSDIPIKQLFGFISAIRVLQYNKTWPEVISKLTSALTEEGVMVFSMLNSSSLNILNQNNKANTFRTTPRELKELLENAGLEVLDMETSSRLPDILYKHAKNEIFAKILKYSEAILHKLLGKTLLGRVIFVAVKKSKAA